MSYDFWFFLILSSFFSCFGPQLLNVFAAEMWKMSLFLTTPRKLRMFTKPDDFPMVIGVKILKLASAPKLGFFFIAVYSYVYKQCRYTNNDNGLEKNSDPKIDTFWISWHWFHFLNSLYCFKIIIFHYSIFVIMHSKQAIDKQYLQNIKVENRLVIHFQKIISSWSCPFNESFERCISRNFC